MSRHCLLALLGAPVLDTSELGRSEVGGSGRVGKRNMLLSDASGYGRGRRGDFDLLYGARYSCIALSSCIRAALHGLGRYHMCVDMLTEHTLPA